MHSGPTSAKEKCMPRNLIFLLCSVLSIPSLAAADSESARPPMRLFSIWEAGQIEEASDIGRTPRVDKELHNRATVWLLQEARLAEHASLFLGVGGGYFFVFPRSKGNPWAHSQRSGFGLTDAHAEFGMYQRGQDELLRLKIGIFNYKYNEDARNLGEYLYRSWTYPTILQTGGVLQNINSAFMQLNGVAASTKIGGFQNDLMLTIQSSHAPVYALSLADIISYNIGGILTVGGGFMFDNFYSPSEDAVTPQIPDNLYYTVVGGDSLPLGDQLAKKRLDKLKQNLLVAGNDTVITDSGYYTFAGQKMMVRASLSLGKLMPSLFAEHELRLYGEAILMGLKDYPTFYAKKMDRVATMVGFNLPTFHLLDLFSVEWEYCPNPFPNAYIQYYEGDGTATPPGSVQDLRIGDFPNINTIHSDDVKWSIYAKKQVYEKFALYAQVARDHLRIMDQWGNTDHDDFLPNRNHWYWMFQLSYAL